MWMQQQTKKSAGTTTSQKKAKNVGEILESLPGTEDIKN